MTTTNWANDDAVIEAATRLAAALGDDPNHTVAAAAMDLGGNIHAAVNNHHFTGGPCAELVVLGLAAAPHAGPIATMVAVGDRDRGVIAPCGRCRQIILDQHPDCCILVPRDDSVVSVPVIQLLPYAYRFPDGSAERFVRFNGSYYDDVATGQKTQTVRYLDPVPLGPTTFVFEDGEHRGFRTMPGVIDSVTPINLTDLDDDYQAGLQNHYPHMPKDAQLDDVRFHI